MATSITVPSPPSSLVPHREWNTLEILTRSRALLYGMTALLLAAIVLATGTHRAAMKLVGQDTAPSIIHAQEIKTALADMDINAADELLNPGSTRSSGLFDQHRIEASNSLMEAAKNVTFGDAEQKPIDTVEIVMGTYERLVQEARDLQDGGQQDMAVRYYRAAAIVMDGTLLPAADALDKANNDMLEQEYETRSTRSLMMRLLVLATGLLTMVALVWAQVYLSRRTRRTLNPGLAGATLVAFLLTVFAFSCMQREQFDLHAAKKDAFDSVHALLQARAVAYSVNANENRALLDPLHADEYIQAFVRGSALLVNMPTPQERAQLPELMRTGKTIPGFTGFLADELNNITYVGERESATNSVLAFEEYQKRAQQVLPLTGSGPHPQVVATEAGDQKGQSDLAFKQFDQALGGTLKINTDEFKTAVDTGFSAVRNVEWIAGGGAVLMIVLIFFGFAPRLREYQ